MASTYDYKTGQITTDFHLVAWDEKCKGSGLPCYAGSDRCTRVCPYCKGTLHSWDVHILHTWMSGRLDNSYVMCGHPNKKDSDTEDIKFAWYVFYEKFKHQALCALDG